MLIDSDDVGLFAGRNLMLVGGELIQFGRAEQIGARHYRLSRLLRGRRGTEHRMAGHLSDEPVMLVEAPALLPLVVPVGIPVLKLQASGIGDVVPVDAALASPGLALLPPSPVHMQLERLGNGDSRISWIRRSRDGWRWIDGIDAALVEESERYRVSLVTSLGRLVEWEVAEAAATYSAVDRQADSAAGATHFAVSIAQIGTFGPSLAASGAFNI
jgi:hypothetical protein